MLATVQAVSDQSVANSLYEIFSGYYNKKQDSTFNRRSEKKISKTKSSRNRSQSQSRSSQPKKNDGIQEYIGYVEKPLQENKAEYNKLVGRKGLGFERRTATSYGLRAPIIPETLTIVGRRYEKEGNENNKGFTIYV